MSDVRFSTKEEEHRYALQMRHKLALESVGLIRTCLHVQQPVFEALINAEEEISGGSDHQAILHDKSFALQLRLVRTCLRFLDELDTLAEEVISLAHKEKFNA
jgi:hypothetical protein